MDYNNIFTGKFSVESHYAYAQEQGWALFRQYVHDDFKRIFTLEDIRQLPAGGSVYEGRLEEFCNEQPDSVCTFSCYPADGVLRLDRQACEFEGFMTLYMSDNYRVVPHRAGEYFLYDQDDMDREPEEYRFRLKLKKI